MSGVRGLRESLQTQVIPATASAIRLTFVLRCSLIHLSDVTVHIHYKSGNWRFSPHSPGHFKWEYDDIFSGIVYVAWTACRPIYWAIHDSIPVWRTPNRKKVRQRISCSSAGVNPVANNLTITYVRQLMTNVHEYITGFDDTNYLPRHEPFNPPHQVIYCSYQSQESVLVFVLSSWK